MLLRHGDIQVVCAGVTNQQALALEAAADTLADELNQGFQLDTLRGALTRRNKGGESSLGT